MDRGRDGLHLVFFSDCPYFGGAEEYVAMLARARPERGWRVSAIVSAGEGGDALARELGAAGAQVRRLTLRPWHRPSLARQVMHLLRGLGGDVLHLNLPSIYDGRMSLPAVLAKACGYRRVVSTEHLPMIERARRLMGVKILCAAAIDAMIVHTEWNRQFLAHRHHLPLRRIHVIPNGSPEMPSVEAAERSARRAQLGIGAQQTALVVAARLTARKGHRFLFAALAALQRAGRGGDWKLWILGDGEEAPALRALAHETGIAARVAFLGHRESARPIIQVADLLVLPSLLESQPLVLTEAMAAGLPVIASRIYGIPEIVADEETGLLVAPGDTAALEGALVRLLDDRGLRQRLGAAGRRRYEERFTQERMAARTYALLGGPLAEAAA